jgi:polysaccharide export outer membrane protein
MLNRRLALVALLAFCIAPIGGLESWAQATPEELTRTYRLGTGDKLRVTVFDEPDLSGEFQINANGVIAMPLVGEVQAKGLTLDSLGQGISEKLREGYVKNPRVNIEVLNYRPFYILGEVKAPGSYPYVAGMTVINAVALAGGFTYRANKDRINIQHPGEPEKSSVPVSEVMYVLPGDIIRVEERFF